MATDRSDWGLKAVLQAALSELERPDGDPRLVIQQLRSSFVTWEELQRERGDRFVAQTKEA